MEHHQSSVVSSVVIVEKDQGGKKLADGPGEVSKDLACRRVLMKTLELKRLSHEDLNNHYCVDWLKTHESNFSREKTLETADLTGNPKRAIFGPVNYR